MLKHLSLLFLTLLCTGASAQTTNTPQMGSGSLVVNFGDDVWFVTISSATDSEYHRFVTRSRYLKTPDRYDGYVVLPDQGRHDLRMVHRLVDQLETKGWQLVDSDHTSSLAADEYSNYQKERMFFRFRAPLEPPSLLGGGDAEMVLAAKADVNDVTPQRGGILLEADGNYVLLVEQAAGALWQEKFRLSDTGLLSEDMVKRIGEIILTPGGLTMVVGLETGDYRYTFEFYDGEYLLTGLRFKSESDCGILAYNSNVTPSSRYQASGYYRPEPCADMKEAKTFYSRENLARISLSSFVPGNRRIDLSKQGGTIFY